MRRWFTLPRVAPASTIALLILFAALFITHKQAGAQTSPPHDMTIVCGKGELLLFERDVHRVVVAEPKIADGLVVSPREVMINAKGPGKTTIIIWENGSIAARYNINVIA